LASGTQVDLGGVAITAEFLVEDVRFAVATGLGLLPEDITLICGTDVVADGCRMQDFPGAEDAELMVVVRNRGEQWAQGLSAYLLEDGRGFCAALMMRASRTQYFVYAAVPDEAWATRVPRASELHVSGDEPRAQRTVGVDEVANVLDALEGKAPQNGLYLGRKKFIIMRHDAEQVRGAEREQSIVRVFARQRKEAGGGNNLDDEDQPEGVYIVRIADEIVIGFFRAENQAQAVLPSLMAFVEWAADAVDPDSA